MAADHHDVSSPSGVRHWLLKTEPEEFSWSDLVARQRACWDGVRNVEARNNLRAMQLGDLALIYHTGKERAAVGQARVCATAYPDPTSQQAIWSAVDVEPLTALERAVTLAELKQHPAFANSPLVRRPRLSVVPLTPDEFATLIQLSRSTGLDGGPSP